MTRKAIYLFSLLALIWLTVLVFDLAGILHNPLLVGLVAGAASIVAWSASSLQYRFRRKG